MNSRRKEKHVGIWDGQRIKKLRNSFGESQTQFCQRLGVGVDALQHWEQDRAEPSRPIQLLLEILQEDIASGKIPAVPTWSEPEKKKQPNGRSGRKREMAKA